MRSDTSYRKGIMAEFIARVYLRLHGYTGRNTHRAEIDIIARRRNTLVFVEVKNYKTIQSAWGAITNAQAARLRRSAETFIAQHKWNGNARFDVIIVCGWKIHWIKNAI